MPRCAPGGIATFAEPAIGALRAAGSGVDPLRAPWLHLLLTRYPDRLVLAVGIGVGLAVVVGMLRFFFAWRMKTLVIATLLPCLALTAYAGDPGAGRALATSGDRVIAGDLGGHAGPGSTIIANPTSSTVKPVSVITMRRAHLYGTCKG